MKNLLTTLSKRLRSTGKTNIISDIYKIVGGTGMAQILIALGTLVLSRIYSEATVGISSIFISLSLILGVIASLRYEAAIVLPQEEEDAIHLLRISLLSIAVVTLISALGIWFFQDAIIHLLSIPDLEPYLLLIPIALASIGVYQTLNLWNTRKKDYWCLSAAKVISAAITIIIQIGIGFWLGDQPKGLIYGFIGGYLGGSLFLGWYIRSKDFTNRPNWNWRNLLANLIRYRKFPLIDTWGNLVNAISWQITPLLLTIFFSYTVSGNYSMAYRLIQLPVSLVAVAIAQVFLQRSSAVKEDAQDLIRITRSVLHLLIGIGIYPSLLLTVLGRDLFIVFLGENWGTAGLYVQILGIWMFFWFVSWPLGMIANIKEKQGVNLIIQTLLLISRVISVALGGLYHNVLLGISLFSISGILVYAASAVLYLRMINYPLRITLSFFAKEILIAATVIGVLVLARIIYPLPSFAMIALAGIISGFFFWFVMKNRLNETRYES